jgi:hypothetical protein
MRLVLDDFAAAGLDGSQSDCAWGALSVGVVDQKGYLLKVAAAVGRCCLWLLPTLHSYPAMSVALVA